MITTATALLGYVGPGPGLTMTWALLGLIGTLLTAFVAFMAWPIRMMIRRFRNGNRTT